MSKRTAKNQSNQDSPQMKGLTRLVGDTRRRILGVTVDAGDLGRRAPTRPLRGASRRASD